jgi:hypothetical protein
VSQPNQFLEQRTLNAIRSASGLLGDELATSWVVQRCLLSMPLWHAPTTLVNTPAVRRLQDHLADADMCWVAPLVYALAGTLKFK